MGLQLAQGEGLEFLSAFLTSRAIGLRVGIEGERSPATLASLWH